MNAEIVIIGDEVLAGRTVDTNSTFLARALGKLGIGVNRVVRVGDSPEAIKRAVAGALVSSRLVFVVGGLGPTPDDRTLPAVCELIERKPVTHPQTEKRIEEFFRMRGQAVPVRARRQALVPEGAEVFPNPVGMVPGMLIEHQGSTLVLLPGVPEEVSALFESGIAAEIEKRFAPGKPVYHSLLRTFGVIESKIAGRVTARARACPGVSVAFYPAPSGLDLFFSGADERMVKRCADAVAAFLKERVYARTPHSLPEVVGEVLKARGLTLGVAESCTGGLIGHLITGVPGASEYFRGGVVAYSNQVKMRLLGVRERTLKKHGAVSAATVREMAVGVCKLLSSTLGVAVSGIAGPGGGERGKPVGLVYIGAGSENRVYVERHIFSGGRAMVKERAAYAALDLLRRVVLKAQWAKA